MSGWFLTAMAFYALLAVGVMAIVVWSDGKGD